MFEDQTSDATIAFELQNMENDEHVIRVEKERLEFEERKEKEMLKMKQVCSLKVFLLYVSPRERSKKYCLYQVFLRLYTQDSTCRED